MEHIILGLTTPETLISDEDVSKQHCKFYNIKKNTTSVYYSPVTDSL